VLKAANIKEPVGVHALRHTFISLLVIDGVDLRIVKDYARHSHFQNTLRYSHLSPDYISTAINWLPEFVTQVVVLLLDRIRHRKRQIPSTPRFRRD